MTGCLYLHTLQQRTRALLEDRTGSVLVIVSGSIIVLMILLGAAVDTGRAYLLRSKMSSAVDAAALAAGARLNYGTPTDAEVVAEAKSFYLANLPEGFLNATIEDPNVTINRSGPTSTVDVIGNATLPTLFMKFAGFHDLPVSNASQVTSSTSTLELAMVLDLSASMHWDGRIEGLQVAATKLLDVLYGNQDTIPNLYIGMVPYAASINIGTNRVGWIEPTLYHPSMYGTAGWKGCVQARDANDFADEPPSPGRLFPPHWADVTIKNNAWATSVTPNGDGTWTVTGPETIDEVWANQWDDPVAQSVKPLPGPNARCLMTSADRIVPLVTQRSTLQAQIDNFATEVWWGGTIHDQGLAWGWRVLSPRWRGVWGNPSENFLPLDYPAAGAKARKIVVMMTDGKAEVGSYGVWGKLEDSFMGTGIDTENKAAKKVEENFSSLCTMMKDQGITIFTIILGLNGNADTETLFRDCASTPDNYFNSPTPADMIAAFTEIGAKIKSLRISK